MAGLRLALHLALIACSSHLASSSDGPQELTAHPGQDVTLKCECPTNAPIVVLEWTRTDLEPPEYVFLYRDEQSDPTHQNPSFADRVELLDREMKNGDASVILKNVNRNDAGTYECHCSAGGPRRTERANVPTEPSSIINLKVEEPGAMDGHAAVGRSFVLVVIASVAVGIVGGLLTLRKQEKKQMDTNSDPAAADEASDQQL
ncbi:V-set and immunoglobulin domain-containing protein 8-like [Centroberyx affinis]|uniref:V-set and immunoglobulin domain-containing protein 8-like n=1 Tax=Centroberyx affinis TaxID=166261 RepID=UPI003A5C2611